jgi:hypothetical protein
VTHNNQSIPLLSGIATFRDRNHRDFAPSGPEQAECSRPGPDDAASGPIAPGLARGLGARDAVLGLGILAAVLRRESSRGWLLAAAGADAADLVLTWTNAWPFGRRTRLLTLAGIALNVMVQFYLAFDQED